MLKWGYMTETELEDFKSEMLAILAKAEHLEKKYDTYNFCQNLHRNSYLKYLHTNVTEIKKQVNYAVCSIHRVLESKGGQ